MKGSVRLVALGAMSALLLSCGDDDNDPTGPGSSENNLVFTRGDQTVISFSSDAQLFVWCGAWQEGEVDTPSLHVQFAGLEDGWQLRAVVADVTLGQPLSFPNNFVFDQPKDVNIFVLDPPNELSTQEDESSGSITFQKLGCGSGDEVQFSIDAVIGSEFSDGTPVSVTGTFRAPIGQPPR
jgi:hypothetical protein